MDLILPYLSYLSTGDIIPGYSYFYHLVWCSQNLFQIQFYRKLFYNFYWRNIETENKSLPVKWLIFCISIVLSCFFSLYFNPADPTHSGKHSTMLRIRFYFKRVSSLVLNLINSIRTQLNLKYNTLSEAFSINHVHRTLALNSVWRI